MLVDWLLNATPIRFSIGLLEREEEYAEVCASGMLAAETVSCGSDRVN